MRRQTHQGGAEAVRGFGRNSGDSGVFHGTIHALDLAICPGMVGLDEAMFNAMCPADPVKRMSTKHHGCTVAVLGEIGELHAVVGEGCMDMVGGGDQCFKESLGRFGVGSGNNFAITNLLVRSTATKRYSFPCSVRGSVMSI